MICKTTLIGSFRWPNAGTLDVARPQRSVTPFQARIGVLLTPLKIHREEILILDIPNLLDRSRPWNSDILGSENRCR